MPTPIHTGILSAYQMNHYLSENIVGGRGLDIGKLIELKRKSRKSFPGKRYGRTAGGNAKGMAQVPLLRSWPLGHMVIIVNNL